MTCLLFPLETTTTTRKLLDMYTMKHFSFLNNKQWDNGKTCLWMKRMGSNICLKNKLKKPVELFQGKVDLFDLEPVFIWSTVLGFVVWCCVSGIWRPWYENVLRFKEEHACNMIFCIKCWSPSHAHPCAHPHAERELTLRLVMHCGVNQHDLEWLFQSKAKDESILNRRGGEKWMCLLPG